MKTLRYGLPDMNEYDIGEYLDIDELEMIAGDFCDSDYDNFTEARNRRKGRTSLARHKKTSVQQIMN